MSLKFVPRPERKAPEHPDLRAIGSQGRLRSRSLGDGARCC
jgi:hypothetical protein